MASTMVTVLNSKSDTFPFSAEDEHLYKVEITAHGHVVVDGVAMDLRGAADNTAIEHVNRSFSKVILKKNPSDQYDLIVHQVYPDDHAPWPETGDRAEGDTTYDDTATFPVYVAWPSGTTQASQTIDSTHADSVPEATRMQRVQSAFTTLHLTRVAALAELNKQAIGHKDDARVKAHNILFRAGEASYIVANDPDLSWAQKLAYAAAVGQGPLDIPTSSGLEVAVHLYYKQVDDYTVPEEPSSWVTPATAVRHNLKDAVTITGNGGTVTTVSVDIDLSNPDWVQDINLVPDAVGTVPDQTVAVGATVDVQFEGLFYDEDALTYEVVSDDTAVATVSIPDGYLTIEGVAAGTASITITATDTAMQTATQVFDVVVSSA